VVAVVVEVAVIDMAITAPDMDTDMDMSTEVESVVVIVKME
jgi:hypothetical protein